jgi:tyrosinase
MLLTWFKSIILIQSLAYAVHINKRQNLCAVPRLRQEWRTLSTDQQQNFVNAVNQLHTSSSFFNDMANAHSLLFRSWHNNALFLPIHREFLFRFEDALLRIDPLVVLPYWDCKFYVILFYCVGSLDAANPVQSVIFQTFGQSESGTCIPNGPFTRWTVSNPSPHCLTRTWARGTGVTLTAPAVLQDGITRFQDYDTFQSWLEFQHNILHSAMGGDMATQYSPNDPIFYLYHASIDKLWDDWQSVDVSTRKFQVGGVDGFGIVVTSGTGLPGFQGRTVADTFDLESRCVRYARSATVQVSGFRSLLSVKNSTVSQGLLLPPRPQPLSEEFIINMNMSVEHVREMERLLKEQYDRVEKNLSPNAGVFA